MGEARYYMRARYENQEAAAEALPRVDAFLQRMAAADDAWQAGRMEADVTGADAKLRADFADVFEALQLPPLQPNDRGGRNAYAGELCSPAADADYEINAYEGAIDFSGTVWHFADWHNLAAALVARFGARSAGWVSDEWTEPDYFTLAEQAAATEAAMA